MRDRASVVSQPRATFVLACDLLWDRGEMAVAILIAHAKNAQRVHTGCASAGCRKAKAKMIRQSEQWDETLQMHLGLVS